MKSNSHVSYYKEVAGSGLGMFLGIMLVIIVSTIFFFLYIFSGTSNKIVESSNDKRAQVAHVSENSFPSSSSLSAH